MPYSLQPIDDLGAPAGTLRTITAGFDGTDTITLSGSPGAPYDDLGDVLEFVGTPLSGDGNYFIIENLGANQFRVQPTPPNNGGSVSGTARGYDASTNVQRIASRAVTSYPAVNQIRSTGAQFVTNGVRPNDFVILTPNGTNEGIRCVEFVIDEDNIQVYNNTSNLSTAAPTTDTIRIVAGTHELRVTDVVGAGWAAAFSAGVTVFQPNFGALSDYVVPPRLRDSAPAPLFSASDRMRDAYVIEGIKQILLETTTGATVTTWTALSECWFNARGGNSGSSIALNGIRRSGTLASPMFFRFGQRTGDRYSGKEGCLLWGVLLGCELTGQRYVDGECTVRVHASGVKTTRTHGGNFYVVGADCEFTTSTLETSGIIAPLASGSGAVLAESLNLISNVGLLLVTDSADIQNLTIDQAATGFFSGAPDARIEGLLKSDESAALLFNAFNSPRVIFLNPRADYPIAELIFNLLSSANLQKRYTFNPRFVSRSASGQVGVPVAGLIVRIFDVNEATQVEDELTAFGSPWTTDAFGRINTAGVELRRERRLATDVVNSHRIVVEGAGYRRVDQVITLTAPFEGDFPVDFSDPDFEGEMSV